MQDTSWAFEKSERIPFTDCWIWSQKSEVEGYGRVRYKGRKYLAHRLAYELTYGVNPGGSLVCHTCDNPSCIRPSHLFLGTDQDNVTDKMRKGRHKTIRGAENVWAKLSDSQVNEIRRRFKVRSRTDGAAALAREFGVTDVTILNVVKRRTYKSPSSAA